MEDANRPTGPRTEETFDLAPFRNELYVLATEVVGAIRAGGHKAFLVGGGVRDTLLATPPTDYDIATSATPDEVARMFTHSVPIGARFGVMLVIHGGEKFEVATFRSEWGYSDGRRPDSVSFSDDEREDVMRRDFTINAMLYDPDREIVIDYVGARRDIEAGLLRAIGDPEERIREDKLRLLRAVRFSSRFGYRIEDKTLEAVRKHAPEITEVSPERIREELTRIITQNNPGLGLRRLHDLGLLEGFLPEAARMDGVPQPEEFHPEGDVLTHTCLTLDRLYEYTDGKPGVVVAMAALLHDIAKPVTLTRTDRIRFNAHDRIGAEMSADICRKLRFSNKQIALITELIREHLKFKDVFNMRQSTLKRFLANPNFEDHMALHHADCMASHGLLKAYEFLRLKSTELTQEEIKPPPLITGHDLIELGYEPGGIFGEILEEVASAQLEGTIADREAAIALVRERYPLKG